MKPLRCLSSVRFGSFLSYSPRGTSEDSAKAKRITYAIKNVRPGFIKIVITRLRDEMQSGRRAAALSEVLGEDVLVVPCPKSAPLVNGALWPSRAICDELVGQGLAMSSAPILERIRVVPKSSTSAVGERPKPLDHMRSMAVVRQPELDLQRITRVTLIDDVITRGATLIAGASLLQQHFPKAEIRVFAVVRTKSYEAEVGTILEPIIGEVVFNGVDADRKP